MRYIAHLKGNILPNLLPFRFNLVSMKLYSAVRDGWRILFHTAIILHDKVFTPIVPWHYIQTDTFFTDNNIITGSNQLRTLLS